MYRNINTSRPQFGILRKLLENGIKTTKMRITVPIICSIALWINRIWCLDLLRKKAGSKQNNVLTPKNVHTIFHSKHLTQTLAVGEVENLQVVVVGEGAWQCYQLHFGLSRCSWYGCNLQRKINTQKSDFIPQMIENLWWDVGGQWWNVWSGGGVGGVDGRGGE